MKRKLLYTIALLFAVTYSLEAQTDVTFKTICKKHVSVGEQFQVSYELNADGKDFKAPNFNNFEIKEDITLIKENAIAITYYWEIFEKYHNKLFCACFYSYNKNGHKLNHKSEGYE